MNCSAPPLSGASSRYPFQSISMKLHRIDSPATNFVASVRPGSLLISGHDYSRSIIVSAQSVDPWEPQTFDAITRRDFEQLAPYDAEIVIIGTGRVLTFPDPSLLDPLRQLKCGYEIMDTAAACRTYNVLAGDDRRVIACLLQIV